MGEHLLLAARERARALPRPLLEPREHGEHAFEVRLVVRAAVHGRAHLQVLADRHAREHAAPLGRLREAEPRDFVGGDGGDVGTLEQDAPRPRAGHPEHGHHKGRFASPVRADECDDLALADVQGDAAQGLDRAVVGFDAFDAEEGGPAHRARPAIASTSASAPSTSSSSTPR